MIGVRLARLVKVVDDIAWGQMKGCFNGISARCRGLEVLGSFEVTCVRRERTLIG